MSALSKTSFRISTPFNQILNRNFHASTANMAIKTYFDCQWTGPKFNCDINGKVISKEENSARTLPLHSPKST